MSYKQHSNMETIAIVGLSARFPGAPDYERFWQNLEGGVESVTFLPEIDGKAPAAGLLDGMRSSSRRTPSLSRRGRRRSKTHNTAFFWNAHTRHWKTQVTALQNTLG